MAKGTPSAGHTHRSREVLLRPAREEEEPCLCHRLLHETTSFCLAEQYKLLSDHIEQMAVE